MLEPMQCKNRVDWASLFMSNVELILLSNLKCLNFAELAKVIIIYLL